jgi:CCR4-NOT transcription complex subunit 1
VIWDQIKAVFSLRLMVPKLSIIFSNQSLEFLILFCLFFVQILSVTTRIIQKDAEEKKASFNPRPYFRLFINWLSELTTSDLHHDSANFQVHMFLLPVVSILYVEAVSIKLNEPFTDNGYMYQVLTAFANAFHILQPLRVSAWRFVISLLTQFGKLLVLLAYHLL